MVTGRTTSRRRNAKQKSGGIQLLPEELVVKILCRVPAEDLVKNCRYVCKAWFQILKHELQNPSFIHLNSLYFEPSCIIFGDWPRGNYFAYSSLHRFKMHAIEDLWIQRPPTTPTCNANSGQICGSSDGFLLIMRKFSFRVLNPLTMQFFKLPPIRRVCDFGVLTRVPHTGEFKVLTVGEDENGSWAWYVITVGLDTSWKILSGLPSKCNPSKPDTRVPCEYESRSVKGIVYVRFYEDLEDFTFAAIDLHNEIGYWLEIPTYCRSKQPFSCFDQGYSWGLFNIGDKHLGYSVFKKVTNAELEMDLWVLKDLCRNEWTLDLRVSFPNPPRMRMVKLIMPRIWFQSTQVMVMNVDSENGTTCFAYFFKRRKFQKLDNLNDYAYLMHGYSLLPLF